MADTDLAAVDSEIDVQPDEPEVVEGELIEDDEAVPEDDVIDAEEVTDRPVAGAVAHDIDELPKSEPAPSRGGGDGGSGRGGCSCARHGSTRRFRGSSGRACLGL